MHAGFRIVLTNILNSRISTSESMLDAGEHLHIIGRFNFSQDIFRSVSRRRGEGVIGFLRARYIYKYQETGGINLSQSLPAHESSNGSK